MEKVQKDMLYKILKSDRVRYDGQLVAEMLGHVSQDRVQALVARMEAYLSTNLAKTINSKSKLEDYRTNPYALMAAGSVLGSDDINVFAQFLRDTKLYMSFETSFGKSVEDVALPSFPIGAVAGSGWEQPAEKLGEFDGLKGLTNEEKARARGADSGVWREIDKSCVFGGVRYLVSIKSGPNTINDTQVNDMKEAVRKYYSVWLRESQQNYGVERLDVVLGLTYGTPKTTNNKDNQFLVKLLEHGFKELDRTQMPGVLVDSTGLVRVYRVVGADFWALVANPSHPEEARFAFLEVLLAVAIALNKIMVQKVDGQKTIEDRLNERLQMLSQGIANLSFPPHSLPQWVTQEIGEREMIWLAAAMTAFYDKGI